MKRRQFFTVAGTLVASTSALLAYADEPVLVEPVHRVAANAASLGLESVEQSSPLDQAIEIAHRSLAYSQQNITDYTAILVKRETVDDTLGEYEFMSAKIRNRKNGESGLNQPLSVYLGFLKPAAVKGREVIYVETQNNGNIVGHEGGLKGRFLPTMQLPPNGMLAMRGQRYPITDIGIENMLVKLIERGTQARQVPDVQCEFRKNARVKDRVCTVIQVTQPTRAPGLEFYQAQIFIDDEFNLPIRYIAYDWPQRAGETGQVIEEYTYLNLAINVGLTDADFDPRNQAYGFYSK
jgi:Protein of unknown function (DUF1571)